MQRRWCQDDRQATVITGSARCQWQIGLNPQALGYPRHFEVSSFFAFQNGTDFEEYTPDIDEIPFWLTFFVLLKPSYCIRLGLQFSTADFIQVEVLQTTLRFQQPCHRIPVYLQTKRLGEADLNNQEYQLWMRLTWDQILIGLRQITQVSLNFSFLTFEVGSLCFLPPRIE